MASYADTVSLLRELTLLGFTDAAYRMLTGVPKDTIAAHLTFATEHRDSAPDVHAERTQQRLRLIRDAYMKAGFRSGREDVFVALASAARAEIG